MTKRFILFFTLALMAGYVSAQEAQVEAQDALEQEVLSQETDTLFVDTLVADPDPEWYVAPISYDSVMARHRSMRRAAASCPIDSVLTFNVDSVLTDVSIYEYGDTTRTITWAINPDGTRVGKAKTEYVYDASGYQIDSAIYAWDKTAHSWYGTAKTECTYEAGKMTSRTEFAWLNGAWGAQKRYTYAYDAAGREVEYILYERNATTGSLDPSKCRIRVWYNNNNVTLVILYTAYTNGAWSDGVKHEYAYDSSGNQIEYTYYSSISNGNWVYSTHELWTYTSSKKTNYEKYSWSNGTWVGTSKETWTFNAAGKQTRHEKFNWSNDNWAISLQENSGFDESGNQNLVENYNISNNVWSGSKKEEYEYSGKTKIGTITYSWTDGAWVNKKWTVSNTVSNPTESCTYNWTKGAWVGSGNRTLTTKTGGKETEKIIQTWSSTEKNWVNKTRDTTAYSGSNVTLKASYKWQNEAWVGTSRTDYHYTNGKNDTIKTYTNDGTSWIFSKRTINTFNASGTNIMTHISNWDGNKWVLASMTRTDIVNQTVDGIRQTCTASWKCGSDSIWKGVEKDTAAYSATGKQIYRAIYDAWSNDAWVAFYRIEYEYDEQDRKTLEQRFDWNINMWKGNYRNEYGFDEQGRQVMTAKYTGWNSTTNSWIGTSKTEQTYYPNNQIASSIASVWGTDTWRQVFRYAFIYDNSGRTITETTEHYENDIWVYTNKKEKEYKGSSLVKNNSFIWLGERWIFSSRNESYYDDDAQAKLRREIIGTWNESGLVSSFKDDHYFYDCDHPYYTISFDNYDGSLLQSYEVKETKKPVYKGETPTRPADDQYIYTFKGWDKTIVAATEDAHYIAVYDSVANKYTITWQNDDGSLIDETEVAYGITPTHENPTKPSTAEYSYVFAGWTPEVVPVTGNATYRATFTQVEKGWVITWQDETGAQIDQTIVKTGVVPTHDDLTKEATAEYTYTFTGWTPAIVAATEDATYRATFSATKNSYTITWRNWDNSQIDQTTVEYGTTPAYEAPTKENTVQYTYTFKGWSPEVVEVTAAAVYTAEFDSTVNTYLVTWQNEDGTEIDHQTLAYGVTPQYTGDTPNKPSNPQYTYIFKGWTPAVGPVVGETSYVADFDSTLNSYAITFKNYDGSVLKSSEVEYGAIPSYPDLTPTKPRNDQYSYTFKGWSPEVVAVTAAAVYTAEFDSTVNTYLVTWQNEDGTEIDHATLAYGATPTHNDPTKAATAEYTYTFAGWTPNVTTVTGDATYRATFTASKNSYTVTWLNEDGSEIDHATLEYGATPTHDDPTKAATAEYTYTFAGWTPEVAAVGGNATYRATFTAAKNKYTVTFVNYDGSVLQTSAVEFGQTPIYSESAPTKPATAQYTYTFTGWSPAITSVTGEATYMAQFDSIIHTYTVIFYYEDGVTEIDRVTVAYGETPHTDMVPSIPGDAQYTYVFAGWSPNVEPATGDASYTATYDRIVKQYEITFKNYNGQVLQSVLTDYGTIPTYTGEEPTKKGNVQYTYTFTGWTPELVAVTGEATYTAVFEEVVNTYIVIFYDEDGITELDRQEVEYGQKPVYGGETPTKAEDEEYTYTFAGWSPKITKVTGDATYRATYTATKKTNGLSPVTGNPSPVTVKVMIDGVIYVKRGDKLYTLEGVLVE